jgi:hypothetical protein
MSADIGAATGALTAEKAGLICAGMSLPLASTSFLRRRRISAARLRARA